MSKKQFDKPSVDDLRKELKRENSKKEYRRVLRNTLVVVIVVAAFAVLVSSFFITVLKVTGDSMTPTLETGDIVIAQNSSEFEVGDLLAFYYNNKVLVKRVIGSPGDWVNIDTNGDVSVNGVLIEEAYALTRAWNLQISRFHIRFLRTDGLSLEITEMSQSTPDQVLSDVLPRNSLLVRLYLEFFRLIHAEDYDFVTINTVFLSGVR